MTDFQVNTGKDEIGKAEELVQEAIEKVSEKLSKDDELYVDVGWTSQEFVIEEMGGTTGKAFSSNWCRIQFNSEGENWKEHIKESAVHEYTHTWFYEQIDGRCDKIWRYVIDEALTQLMVEEVLPDSQEPMKNKFSREEISEYWEKIKEKELEKDTSEPSTLYRNHSDEGFPNWLGYSLSYLIGQELLKEYNLQEFPELEKKDVIRIGNKLFGENETTS